MSISDGDHGRLLLYCHTGCKFADIIAALRSRGILQDNHDDHRNWRPDPKVERQRRNADLRDRRRRVEAAQRAWRRALPIQPNDPVDLYLQSRNLAGPWPATLRTLWRPWQWRGAKVPVAMVVAATRWPGRQVLAVQVTALDLDGCKATVKPIRKTFGISTGAAVRIGRWSDGVTIIITEGTEDALAILQAVPGAASWATLGTGMARNVTLPAGCEVILVLDGDTGGRLGAIRTAEVFHAKGHPCRVAWLPAGADPNSMLQSQDGAGSPAS